MRKSFCGKREARSEAKGSVAAAAAAVPVKRTRRSELEVAKQEIEAEGMGHYCSVLQSYLDRLMALHRGRPVKYGAKKRLVKSHHPSLYIPQ